MRQWDGGSNYVCGVTPPSAVASTLIVPGAKVEGAGRVRTVLNGPDFNKSYPARKISRPMDTIVMAISFLKKFIAKYLQ